MEQHTSIVIEAPVARAWAIMRDVEQWPEWTASVRRGHAARRRAPVGARAPIDQPRIPTTVWTVTGLTEGRDFTWEASSPRKADDRPAHRRGDRAGHLPGRPLDHPVGLGRLARRARLPVPHRPLPRPGGRRASRREPSPPAARGLGPRLRRGPGLAR